MEDLRRSWPDEDRRDDALQRLLETVYAARAPAIALPDALTESQARILHAASYGLDRKEAAAALGLSPLTVQSHLQNIRRLLAAKNTTHAVAIALRAGLMR